MQQWARIAGSSAALVALLLGISRHWVFWSVIERAVLSYLVVYGIVGGLLVLGRIALRSEPAPQPETTTNDPERPRTDGTDAAI